MMRIYHVKAEIGGELHEYDVQSEEELMKDKETYDKNGIPYSVSRRNVE